LSFKITARVSGSVMVAGSELLGLPEAALAKIRSETIAYIPRAADYPHEFSGGMRQRVVIAMANDPAVIIADEPTTALDVTIQAQVLEALRTARDEAHASLVLITHDLGVVAGMADRVMVMHAGKAVETGSADTVFYRSRMPYTLGLLGSLPRLDTDADEPLRPIPGAPPSLLNLGPGCPFAPRCPLVSDRCLTSEPELAPVGGGEHRAACYRSAELDGAGPDLFAPAAGDGGAEVVPLTVRDEKNER
jgi:oligopeptide/dipeptide ABC transporter ATP-binding protein